MPNPESSGHEEGISDYPADGADFVLPPAEDTLDEELTRLATEDPAAYMELMRIAHGESRGDMASKALVMRGAAAAIRYMRGAASEEVLELERLLLPDGS